MRFRRRKDNTRPIVNIFEQGELVWAGSSPAIQGIVREVVGRREYIVTTNYWNIYHDTSRYHEKELRHRATGHLSTDIVSYAR